MLFPTTGGWTNNGTTYTKTGTYGTATLTIATGVVRSEERRVGKECSAWGAGASVRENFTVYVKDGSTGNASTAVNFAITGTNDKPTVTAGAQDFTLVEAGVGTGGTAAAIIIKTKTAYDTST